MTAFKITVEGDEELRYRLTRLAHTMVNTEPAMQKIVDLLFRNTNYMFSSQGRRGGGSWARLSPKWLAYKRRHGFDLRILQMRGPLRTSVVKRNAPHQILNVTDTVIDFGTDLEYANIHQHGIPGRMPKRQFIKITEDDSVRFKKIIEDHIMKGWTTIGR